MNQSNGKGSMSTSTSAATWKSNDAVPDQFPVGLRVLVVDDDPTCLMILEKMLRTCLYEVTKCNRAEHALSLLRENKSGFDVVISDVHMPDMDGFKLLEHIGLEMDLPVIMMSADDGKQVVMKGVTHGACDYLIKPVRIEALKNIWQHVVRKKKNEWRDVEQSGSVEEGDRPGRAPEDADYSSSANEGSWKPSKKRKEEEDEGDDRDDSSTLKKPRVVWSVELHQQFVAAVNQLGIDKAVPKKILELMNVPGLTRENVASHLQKYRLYLRRLSGQHQTGMNNSFMSPQDAAFGPMTSLNGIDLQTLAVTCQLPAQSLATLQAAGLGRPQPKSGLPLPLVDQRNLFSFENPKLRFGDGQPQQHLGNTKPMNLLHGIPTSMEPKQLTSMHQSAQSLGLTMPQVNPHGAQNNPLLVQMAQSQARGQALKNPIANGGVSLGRNGIGENGRPNYNPVLQNPSMLNFPINQTTASELPGNSFPLASTPSISGISHKGPFAEEVHSDVKGSSNFVASYDIFNDLNQHKSNDWELQNVGLPFDTSHHSNAIQNGGLDLVHQGFSSGQRNAQIRNQSSVGKGIYSVGETDNGNSHNVSHHNINTFLGENSVRVKTECLPEVINDGTFYPEQFGQEDLMSALFKQQEGIAPTENQFDLDGYSMDNIPV